ncbi:MAG: ATP-dependent Clp protease proteolytic subunit, partial [Thermodesulfobacteriaceae bacterium]|nr:ATP-dependent Clp protease proteolytic subunit [Thermodesulfobacteriaceae bacterium]
MRKLFNLLIYLSIFLVFWGGRANAQRGEIFVIKIDGAITPVTSNFISYALNLAKENRGKALIIELDTPGGLVESTREIVKEILQSDIPVIIYVSPQGARAASAGVFILLASHLAAMAPSTHVGAAHPVELSGKADSKMMEKIANDLATWAKNLAETRGRNPQFAELAVKKSKSITEKEALKQRVIEIVAVNLEDLINQAEGRKVKVKDKEIVLSLKGAPIKIINEDLKTRILKILANPNLVYFLLMLGLLGIY